MGQTILNAPYTIISFCRLFKLKLTWKVISYCIRQLYFFSKTGYWLRVCYGWFHLQGRPRAVRNASRARITKWTILAHCEIRAREFPLTKRRCYHWATKTGVCRMNKSSPGRWSKIICRVFLSYDICIVWRFKGPGTALIETEPFQVYTNETHS